MTWMISGTPILGKLHMTHGTKPECRKRWKYELVLLSRPQNAHILWILWKFTSLPFCAIFHLSVLVVVIGWSYHAVNNWGACQQLDYSSNYCPSKYIVGLICRLIFIYIYTYLYIYIYMAHIYIYPVYIYIHVYIYMYVCMYVCVCVRYQTPHLQSLYPL